MDHLSLIAALLHNEESDDEGDEILSEDEQDADEEGDENFSDSDNDSEEEEHEEHEKQIEIGEEHVERNEETGATIRTKQLPDGRKARFEVLDDDLRKFLDFDEFGDESAIVRVGHTTRASVNNSRNNNKNKNVGGAAGGDNVNDGDNDDDDDSDDDDFVLDSENENDGDDDEGDSDDEGVEVVDEEFDDEEMAMAQALLSQASFETTGRPRRQKAQKRQRYTEYATNDENESEDDVDDDDLEKKRKKRRKTPPVSNNASPASSQSAEKKKQTMIHQYLQISPTNHSPIATTMTTTSVGTADVDVVEKEQDEEIEIIGEHEKNRNLEVNANGDGVDEEIVVNDDRDETCNQCSPVSFSPLLLHDAPRSPISIIAQPNFNMEDEEDTSTANDDEVVVIDQESQTTFETGGHDGIRGLDSSSSAASVLLFTVELCDQTGEVICQIHMETHGSARDVTLDMVTSQIQGAMAELSIDPKRHSFMRLVALTRDYHDEEIMVEVTESFMQRCATGNDDGQHHHRILCQINWSGWCLLWFMFTGIPNETKRI